MPVPSGVLSQGLGSKMASFRVGSQKAFSVQRLAPPRANLRRRQQTSMSAVAEPATLEVKSFEGTSVANENLALKVAEDTTATGLVHRYLVTVRQNARRGTASTLTRSEVQGGGRKPYAQKGTGGARRGSRRSPLLPGGGVSFGPKPKDWSIKMNKKERRLALSTALQSAASSISVVQDFEEKFAVPKTKNLVQALERWGVDQEERCLLVVSKASEGLKLASRNVEKLAVNTAEALNIYDLLRADKIIVDESALKYIQEFYGSS